MVDSPQKLFKTPILPVTPIYYNEKTKFVSSWEINSSFDLDYKSIAVFSALGFMFGDKTYFRQIKVIPPATQYEMIDKKITIKNQWWDWNHTPENLSLSNAVEEFASIFQSHISKAVSGEKVILPISGGIDSRSLLVPLVQNNNLNLLSYNFENGFDELQFGQAISKLFQIPQKSYLIPKGYIWNQLDNFVSYNGLLTDFTHPRQVAVLNKTQEKTPKIISGHWGDVLFDVSRSIANLNTDEQVQFLVNSFSNEGGRELAEDLWKLWGLPDSFQNYIETVFDKCYREIKIDNSSSRMRAFKSLYWAPRFTSVNLNIFKNLGALVLPYYSNEMCNFICRLPEQHLSGRKIQIRYIKKYCPDLATIPWQKYFPLNLKNYEKYYSVSYLPHRIINKLKRDFTIKVLNKKTLIEQNWENQFLGNSNDQQLQMHLLSNRELQKLIPLSITKKYYLKFKTNPHKYAHAVSMLLTLSVFSRLYYSK